MDDFKTRLNFNELCHKSRVPVILIEGARRVGKSTLANLIKTRYLGSYYIHNSFTTLNSILEDISFITYMRLHSDRVHDFRNLPGYKMNEPVKRFIIIDRWYLSGWVYHSLLHDERESNIFQSTSWNIREVDESFSKYIDLKICLTYAPTQYATKFGDENQQFLIATNKCNYDIQGFQNPVPWYLEKNIHGSATWNDLSRPLRDLIDDCINQKIAQSEENYIEISKPLKLDKG